MALCDSPILVHADNEHGASDLKRSGRPRCARTFSFK
jgi:hypothetical protein